MNCFFDNRLFLCGSFHHIRNKTNSGQRHIIAVTNGAVSFQRFCRLGGRFFGKNGHIAELHIAVQQTVAGVLGIGGIEGDSQPVAGLVLVMRGLYGVHESAAGEEAFHFLPVFRAVNDRSAFYAHVTLFKRRFRFRNRLCGLFFPSAFVCSFFRGGGGFFNGGFLLDRFFCGLFYRSAFVGSFFCGGSGFFSGGFLLGSFFRGLFYRSAFVGSFFRGGSGFFNGGFLLGSFFRDLFYRSAFVGSFFRGGSGFFNGGFLLGSFFRGGNGFFNGGFLRGRFFRRRKSRFFLTAILSDLLNRSLIFLIAHFFSEHAHRENNGEHHDH